MLDAVAYPSVLVYEDVPYVDVYEGYEYAPDVPGLETKDEEEDEMAVEPSDDDVSYMYEGMVELGGIEVGSADSESGEVREEGTEV